MNFGLKFVLIASIAGVLAWAANAAPLQPSGNAQSQGAGYGYSRVKGPTRRAARRSSPTGAPVMAAARLRKGNTISGNGGPRLIGDAVATARAVVLANRPLACPPRAEVVQRVTIGELPHRERLTVH